ncbi:MAG: DMT family transporter [Rickettsiales bacterium]
MLAILPWCFSEGIKGVRTKHIWLHASRGFLSISGTLSLFYAIKYIALTNITAVGYLEQVVLVIIGILYFKEKATLSKVSTIVLSFLGAMIVVYPEVIHFPHVDIPGLGLVRLPQIAEINLGGEFNYYYIFVFLSIVFWAANCTVIKILGKTENTKVQLFYVMLISCFIAYPFAFFNWQEIELFGMIPVKVPTAHLDYFELGVKLEHLPIIALLAFCYFIHSIAMFNSFRYAEMSTVIPFDYSRIIFTGVFGFMFFSELPEESSCIGYGMIVFSGIYLVRAESQRRKNARELEMKQQLETEYENA